MRSKSHFDVIIIKLSQATLKLLAIIQLVPGGSFPKSNIDPSKIRSKIYKRSK